MRVAVIGGGLLGCATTADISLVQEIDASKGVDVKHEVTIFCEEKQLGGVDFRSVEVNGIEVEVGRYRRLTYIKGTYLADLLALANGERGTVSFLGRAIRIPGETRTIRGRRGAAKREFAWNEGSYGRVVRSAGVWDYVTDSYATIHKGWPVLDVLCRLLNNEIWRALAVVGLVRSIQITAAQSTPMTRAQALVAVVLMFGFVIFSPAGIMKAWQRTYSFWGTTIPLLLTHGLTAGISRGSVEGFVKAITENNNRNRATCAPSLGALVKRTGLEPYLRGSGADYSSRFNYNAAFVQRYIAPHVEIDYCRNFENVNSLACHFAMLNADYSNSDAHTRICNVTPTNSHLCSALVDAARATTPVHLETETWIVKIAYNDAKSEYTLTTSDGAHHQFDAVVLAECPEPNSLSVESPRGDDAETLLGYNVSEVEEGPATHIAVVEGVARASFFRFANERQIPDVVNVTNSAHFSRFERVQEVSTGDGAGLYVVNCSGKFVDDGVCEEMFEDGANVVYYEKVAASRYSASPVHQGEAVDDGVPPLVLGTRFIYVAAARAIATHPEMDAMAALNAASLFSRAVNWETANRNEDSEEESEEE